mmetsp:Transcript_839/g.1755  ORF Transcript_839/g.1755 Transcript_839/m.1755 type:complete len:478 (+) Transcript_839:194-1627(+)
MSYSTFEYAKARENCESNPDNIYYDKNAAFRNQDYRQVYHQDGTIGTFSVRLLEAADLSRHYWSALALGPMKHLGLSNAHGGVSSCVSFCLNTTIPLTSDGLSDIDDLEKKMPAKIHVKNEPHECSEFVSPVVSNDNNPVWTNCQFEIPLKKGALHDGQPVQITLRVDEDATALENMIPGITSSVGSARLLGLGHLDVTSLCLGQNPATGRPTTGVIDAWVPIRLPDKEDEHIPVARGSVDEDLLLKKNVDGSDFAKKLPPLTSKENTESSEATGGRVRVLITYTPQGLEPQRNDIVALEAFARQNSRTATCQSILPPLLPMHVMKVSEPWLLVKYCVSRETSDNELRDYHYNSQSHENPNEVACMRVHRNAVFVIERKTLLDDALNIALQPAELLLSTPLGKGAREAFGPLIAASKQLLMPALLSSKLVWMAVRATALAGLTGMSAAGSAFVNEGANSLTKDTKRRHDENRKVRYV